MQGQSSLLSERCYVGTIFIQNGDYDGTVVKFDAKKIGIGATSLYEQKIVKNSIEPTSTTSARTDLSKSLGALMLLTFYTNRSKGFGVKIKKNLRSKDLYFNIKFKKKSSAHSRIA